MFDELKRKIDCIVKNKPVEKKAVIPLFESLDSNIEMINAKFPDSMDLNSKKITLGGVDMAFFCCEGLVNSEDFTISLIKPLERFTTGKKITPEKMRDYIENKSVMSPEQKKVFDFDELFRRMMSGFVIVLIMDTDYAFAFGMQGYKYRSISEPTNEVNELGPKEAFTEPIRVNLSMVRRRIKSPDLRFNLLTVGTKSKTDICMVYLSDRTSKQLIKDVKKRINKINMDIILDSSYVRPFLEDKPYSLFSSVGVTERPDVLCGKINEGRIAVLVDGSPYALIVPFLFNENFKSFDDYAHRPYFSTFIRVMKYFSFYISFLLPGGYVAITGFHPELLPRALLYSIATSEQTLPFSLTVEALFIYLVFEIMREAGIRLPNAVGHTIGIVGALVIGEAAVNAGLVGAPMVMVVAVTAICVFSVPQLYEPVMILRFAFIIIGGTMGLFGIFLSMIFVSAVICSMNSMHVPVTAPLSPFDFRWINDSFIFTGIKKFKNERLKIQNVKGSELKESGEVEDE